MPNFCSNYISITGNKDNLKKIANILKKMKTKSFVMEALIGLPPEDTVPSITGSKNSTYYGTKWDFNKLEAELDIQKETISMNPFTAWVPPINFLIELCKKFNVSAHIEYSEPGNDFAGVGDINNEGETDIKEMTYLEYSYEYEDECFWENEVRQPISDWETEADVEPYEIFSAKFDFISDEDKITLREIYDEIVAEIKE